MARGEALARRFVVEGRAEEGDDAVADHLVEDAAVLPDEVHRVAAPDLDELGDRAGDLQDLLREPREPGDVDVEDRDLGLARARGSAAA